MRTYIFSVLASLILLASSAQAATWERPAGAYTPTNHSVNITKYQTDRANGVAISSAKVDGDINKAFEGLNSLEARVAPSVVGQSGKFLANNGSASFWGLISPTSISSGAATSGQVLKANGTGSTVFGLLDATSFTNLGVAGSYTLPVITVNTAGFITAVTNTQTVSVSNVIVSNSLTVSGTAGVSGSLTVTGTLNVSGTIAGSGALGVAKAWVNMVGSGSCTVTSGYNVSGCSRPSTGNYGVSFTTPMADANYGVICTARGGPTTAALAVLSGETGTIGKSTTGFGISVVGNFSYGKQDSPEINCAVFGN